MRYPSNSPLPELFHSFRDFEGIIPEGEYGAGRVVIWDGGDFRLLEQTGDKIVFSMEGNKLQGNFALVRLRKSKTGKDWLLIKQKDKHALPGWKLSPILPPG